MSNTTLKKRKKKAPRKNIRSSKTSNSSIEYSVKTRKKGRGYIFQVMQGPCGQHAEPRVVQTFNFREKAKEFADFHNKNQIWKVNGGIPKFLLD